jgi:hypothetical protein
MRTLIVVGLLMFPASAAADIILRTYEINDSTPFTLLGSARQGTVALPEFDTSLGQLDSVTFRHQLAVTIDARTTATGGTFIPPVFISSYTWQARSVIQVTGAGLAVNTDQTHSRFGHPDRETFDTFAQELVEETFDSGIIVLSSGDVGFAEFVTGPTIDLFYGHTVEFPPLSPSPAGFTWDPLTTITGAGIAQTFNSTIDILYDYTPASTTAVPEPTPAIALLIALGPVLIFRRFRS